MIANFAINLTLFLPTIIAPNLNTFSADNPKSVYLDNNKEYYFYIKTNIQLRQVKMHTKNPRQTPPSWVPFIVYIELN